MDITSLVSYLVPKLIPCLPYLLKFGEKAGDGAAEEAGKDMWSKAKEIWAKLRPKAEANKKVNDAFALAAANPESKGRQQVLTEELEALLKNDEALAKEIAEILQPELQTNTGTTNVHQPTTGNGNQVVGVAQDSDVFQNVQGSVTIQRRL
jgi:hypothetical protein